MKLDSICNQIYVVALNEARIQHHEYLTPEHFLYAAVMFDLGRNILEKSGGNINEIKQDLLLFFDQDIPKRTIESPIDSFEFIQMLELATAQAHSSGKQLVLLGNMFAAIFNLQDSFASYCLQKNGVDRLSMIKVISHEIDMEHQENHLKNQENKSAHNDIEFLNSYTVNYVEKALKNEFDPLIGRENILERTIQVLCRRLKNNPIHVGDPGVGKTAIVEGFAQRIADGKAPELLLGSQIFYIDIGSVVAGTKYRGDFEERLIHLMEIISKFEKPIVYLDEIHTVVGAGATSGGGIDASGILKPYLTKGTIRFIGSTTHEEYKKYFEKDRALSRRFQRIDVEEPGLEESVKILVGIKEKYESYHHVVYADAIIRSVCEMAQKYMQDRFMPDKAIDIMDETGAFLRMKQTAEFPYIVQPGDIQRTVALMAKIPEQNVSANEIEQLRDLDQEIKKQIFGQDQAVDTVVGAIKASRSGLNDIEKPIASLLFVGPTGVGKTEIAKQTAVLMNMKLIRYDMSEYQEKHSVARLIGSPPGYVGYEEGGLLTEAIRKTPHCVLLLDEIEKAHPDIYNVLLQIMDYGNLTDNIGKKSDFRNVILIMTSNAGAKEIGKKIIGFDERSFNSEAIDKEVGRIFNPEFRNRLDEIVIFQQINMDMARKITEKSIQNLRQRLINKNVHIEISEPALDFIASKGLSEIYGAREIIRVVEHEIKKKLVDKILFGSLKDGGEVVITLEQNAAHIQLEEKETFLNHLVTELI